MRELQVRWTKDSLPEAVKHEALLTGGWKPITRQEINEYLSRGYTIYWNPVAAAPKRRVNALNDYAVGG
jgi:hypothetical protein